MIYLEISFKKFLKRYPEFIKDFPLKCECGKLHLKGKPYITKRNVGIVIENCQCGRITSIATPRTKEAELELLQII